MVGTRAISQGKAVSFFVALHNVVVKQWHQSHSHQSFWETWSEEKEDCKISTRGFLSSAASCVWSPSSATLFFPMQMFMEFDFVPCRLAMFIYGKVLCMVQRMHDELQKLLAVLPCYVQMMQHMNYS
jgi:hypothetical protein